LCGNGTGKQGGESQYVRELGHWGLLFVSTITYTGFTGPVAERERDAGLRGRGTIGSITLGDSGAVRAEHTPERTTFRSGSS